PAENLHWSSGVSARREPVSRGKAPVEVLQLPCYAATEIRLTFARICRPRARHDGRAGQPDLNPENCARLAGAEGCERPGAGSPGDAAAAECRLRAGAADGCREGDV